MPNPCQRVFVLSQELQFWAVGGWRLGGMGGGLVGVRAIAGVNLAGNF
ncbi:hypothetical protein PN441_04935 [Spirulina major CS-329]|nr:MULTISPECIES: hypothetical protein [Spirulina]MDB9493416.1 hypothetical protein [Spirulina subsalsa CS-330]MDB9502408.1 hypothetical protein [Spirulina major CS-329]